MIKKILLSKHPWRTLRGHLSWSCTAFWSIDADSIQVSAIIKYEHHNAEQSHYNRSFMWTLDHQAVAFFFLHKTRQHIRLILTAALMKMLLTHLNVPKVARKWVAAWSLLTQAPKLTRQSVFSSFRSWALHWEHPPTSTTTPAGSRLASSWGMSSPGRKYQRRTNTRTNHPAVA